MEKNDIPQVEEEEKKESEQVNEFNPVQDVNDALKELNIDPQGKDFQYDKMVQKFQEMSIADPDFQVRDRYKHLLKILGEHKFWGQQAIVQPLKKIPKIGEIQKFNPKEIPNEPQALPSGFEWAPFDCENDEQCQELCNFLEEHYVEDNMGNFRLKYSNEKLRWGIASPGYIKELQFLIRNSKNQSILACIFGIPKTVAVLGKEIRLVEVNFLAVHRNLRAKRMAQVLISEMMRRKRKLGYPQAFYTSGHSMPTPFCTIHYMNRFINCEKLVDIKYTNLPPGKTMKQFSRIYQLPAKEGIKIEGKIRPMEVKDVNQVLKLFNKQQEKYKVYYKMSKKEINHFLVPKEGIVWTWVIENNKQEITDFFSVNRLQQSCTSKEANEKGYFSMNSCCLFYYSLQVNQLIDVIKHCMWLAKEELDSDAFSVMDLMDNKSEMYVDKLNFLAGDGQLYYYFVNYSTGEEIINSNDIGTILI